MNHGRRPIHPLLLALLAPLMCGCGLLMAAGGYPPEAMRKAPPVGIESALALGAMAPGFELASSTGGEVALEKVLLDRSVLLIFFRGDW